MLHGAGGRLVVGALLLGCATTGTVPAAPPRRRGSMTSRPRHRVDEALRADEGARLPDGTLVSRLRHRVDEGLRADEAGRAEVAREGARLPDGTLFVRVLPALAYANLSISGAMPADEARGRVGPCVDALLAETAARVGVGDLARLDDLRGHATWLGELAMVLGVWRRVGGDARYEAVHARVTDVLAEALRRGRGGALRSYPALRWSFDTVPALLALRLRDAAVGDDRHRALIDRALAWGDAHVDAATGLPGSRMALEGDGFTDVPRGSDLALRVALLAELDPARARAMYGRFVAHFGREVMGVPAFAEWPDGLEREADGDSGAIVMGVGLAATGFGVAAARATGDEARARALRDAMAHIPQLLAAAGQSDAASARWVTGSLTGDAAMLFGLTWTDWGVALR
jgi:hypothetical protein